MSHSHHTSHAPKADYYRPAGAGAILGALGVAALIGWVICIAGLIFWTRQLAFSWLQAFMVFFTICAGALFWILIHHATDAAWSVVIRRQYENIASIFPIIALLFIPILVLGSTHLYGWMRIAPGEDYLLDHKSAYLNVPFYYIRTAIYLIFFVAAGLLFRYFSTKQDIDGDVRWTFRTRPFVFASLPLFALSLTFGAVDWLMTLDHHWFSTMWGVYIFAGSALSALCVVVLLITMMKSAGALQVVNAEHYHILGKLMFAFTIFWAYIGFSQYMLIWYANIPEETSYYLIRSTESWSILNNMLMIGHFFVPFLFLITRKVKRTPKLLCIAAVWILFMHWLDMYIIVMPRLHPYGFTPHLLDVAALVAIGCTAALGLMWVVRRGSTFPVRDPRLAESLKLIN